PRAGELVVRTASWPVAIVGLLGIVPLVRHAPRLALAAFAVGLLWPALFMGHSLTHPHFYVYVDIALAMSACALCSLRNRWLRGASLLLLWALVPCAWWTSARLRSDTRTDFYAEAAKAANAAGKPAPGGAPLPVLTNATCVYPYYVT